MSTSTTVQVIDGATITSIEVEAQVVPTEFYEGLRDCQSGNLTDLYPRILENES